MVASELMTVSANEAGTLGDFPDAEGFRSWRQAVAKVGRVGVAISLTSVGNSFSRAYILARVITQSSFEEIGSGF